MLVLKHETDETILVLADDQGLDSPMMRDEQGAWLARTVSGAVLLDEYVQVLDHAQRAQLLKQALAAQKKVVQLQKAQENITLANSARSLSRG